MFYSNHVRAHPTSIIFSSIRLYWEWAVSLMRDGTSQSDILQLVIGSSLVNAERFLNDAVLLANNSSFCHAFAFAILALEETDKAIYLD